MITSPKPKQIHLIIPLKMTPANNKIPFGLAKKVIKALKAEFSVAELENGFGIYYALYFAGSWNDYLLSPFIKFLTERFGSTALVFYLLKGL